MRPHVAQCVSDQEMSGKGVAFTFRCCGNPRTDSTIHFPLETMLDDKEIDLRRRMWAANVEAKHEAALQVMERASQKQVLEAKDHDGNTHQVQVHKIEHWADEIVRIHYRCCDDPDHIHHHDIEQAHQHTMDEVDAHLAVHAEAVAKRHGSTTKERIARVRAAGRGKGAGGEGDAKKSL